MSGKNETKSSTALWRLDLLETKFLAYTPRYNNTKKLLAAKKSHKLLKKLPDEQDAPEEIASLKRTIFESKQHGAYKKLHKEVSKKIKSDKQKWDEGSDLSQFANEELISKLVESKLIKVVQSCILTTKELKATPPSFLPPSVASILADKKHPSHPSRFFIDYCQNSKAVNSYVSSLWNTKSIKQLLGEIERTFILVRGNLTKLEKNDRRRAQGKTAKKDDEPDSDDEDISDDDGDSGSGSGSDESDGEPEIDAQEAFEKFAVYDKLLAGSDEEDEDKPELNPAVNYNEVTDEEPSDSDSGDEPEEKDDFFEESSDEETTEKKYNLPALATGYYSGESDNEDNFEVDNDKVVKQATTQRKNRRGQRARQKIWEQKYGSGAKHKEKERTEYENDRKRRQLEFEEREAKRQLKAKLAPTGSNTAPLGERGQAAAKEAARQEEHPSWKAKKLAEEKLKNTKFTGKKIVFD